MKTILRNQEPFGSDTESDSQLPGRKSWDKAWRCLGLGKAKGVTGKSAEGWGREKMGYNTWGVGWERKHNGEKLSLEFPSEKHVSRNVVSWDGEGWDRGVVDVWSEQKQLVNQFPKQSGVHFWPLSQCFYAPTIRQEIFKVADVCLPTHPKLNQSTLNFSS